MNKRPALIVAAAVFVLVGAGTAAIPQPAPQPAGSPPSAPYLLTMGDMMNTLIQPRHAKLGLAGHAQNWALAAYAAAEIRQSFASIAKAQPKFAGMPVGELVDAAVIPALDALDAAIKAQDSQKFAAAYDQLSQGCNACHMELQHGYVVIKTPAASAFPNQEFGVRQ